MQSVATIERRRTADHDIVCRRDPRKTATAANPIAGHTRGTGRSLLGKGGAHCI
ncbi:hypothetical protein MPRI_18430 [Mycobacterium paraintracellulare]|uniref:Uncharacterized protein n=1 Tax=Mycobacterium paraintracellulare TaxID=1138383 RepID=A0ABM7K6R7_9MYCO|nr:hypothetical protein MPRI_18430 [Mycobacterium paraintracellulare]